MAEQSMFWETAGVGHGPVSGYSQQRVYNWLRKTLLGDLEAAQGVLANFDNELEVTGTSSPLSANTGAAYGYGFFYENLSAKALAVTTPSVGTTGGRINLKVDWTAKTATIEVNRNTDGIITIPALDQTPESVYEIPLYTFTITTGGTITLTDVRGYVHFSTKVSTEMLDDLAVTTAKIAADAVTAAKIAAAVAGNGLAGGGGSALSVNVDASTIEINADTLRVKDLGITSGKLGADAVIAGKIADGAVDVTASLANDIVDDTKVGNRVPQFYRRQGGSATDWTTPGTTERTPTTVRMQGGSITVALGSADTVQSATVTFPVAFSQPPLVLVTIESGGLVDQVLVAYSDSVSASAFLAVVRRTTSGTARNYTVHWLAIGAE